MDTTSMFIDDSQTTVVEQVTKYVREQISAKGLKRGSALPSYRELAAELGVGFTTVKLAMDGLAEQGIVRRQRARGCYVNKELSRAPCEARHVGLIYGASRWALTNYPYLREIVQGINSGSPQHADLHIFAAREQGRLIDAAQLGEWAVDGAVLLGIENDDYLGTFATWGTPGVVVDYVPWNVPLDYFACDNAAAVRRTVEHLAALGHRRVVYASAALESKVLNPQDLSVTLLRRKSSDARERREESLRVLRDRGMFAAELSSSAKGEDGRGPVGQIAAALQAGSGWPTAVMTDSDIAASGLLTELRGSGIRVPEDLSICAVAGSGEFARSESVRVTSCQFDFVAMGRQAAERLIELCGQSEPDTPRGHRIGFTFVEGETTRRANANQGE